MPYNANKAGEHGFANGVGAGAGCNVSNLHRGWRQAAP
jgi:hypothetical protein